MSKQTACIKDFFMWNRIYLWLREFPGNKNFLPTPEMRFMRLPDILRYRYTESGFTNLGGTAENNTPSHSSGRVFYFFKEV